MVPVAHSTCTSIRSAVKMKLTVVTTVLLGLLLTPALAEYFQNQQVTREIRVNGGVQILSINRESRVVIVEQRSEFGTWKTIWNFNTGFIATELMSEGICLISTMNRNLLPTFETFPTVVQGFQGLKGQIQPTRVITFVLGQRVVPDLRIYGPDIFNTCRESTTVLASPVPELQLQPIYNEGACTTLNILNLVQLNYCRTNVNIKEFNFILSVKVIKEQSLRQEYKKLPSIPQSSTMVGAGVSTGRAFPAPHVGPEPQLTWHRKGPQGTKPKVLRRKSSQHKSVLNQVLEELDKVEHDLSHDTGETVAFQKRGDQVVPIYDEGTWTMKSRGMPELPNPGEARQAGINGLLDKIPGYINHNPTKVKAPAYTCRGAKAPAEGGCSPGPHYYVEPSMTRTGKYVAPAYAITGLPRIKTEIILGPSDYSPEKSNRHVFKCPPEPSMAFRNQGVKTNLSPGPSTYTLPRVLGPNTAHTPASPCYSMKSRSQRDRYDADLAKVVLIKPQAPAATFGLRHSMYTTPLILDI
ncbi:hypothetical protein Q9966_013633 [Columba livia]|nr:hypothetical protein Q9966_013633 [Columba livia]